MNRFSKHLIVGLTAAFAAHTLATAEALKVSLNPDDFRPAERYINTYNSNLTLPTLFVDLGYGSDVLREATAELNATGLRFPGGTISNNYLWEKDSFETQADDKTKWAARVLKMFKESGKKLNMEAWVKLCETNNMIPMYSLNIYHETPESTVRLLDTIKSYGGELKHIELGTEVYWDPRSHNDVEAYINYCKPLAAAIRAYDPTIQLGANFGPFNKPGKYETKWNKALAKEDFYDAIVHHDYYGGQGIAVDAGIDKKLDEVLYPDGFMTHLVELSHKHDRDDMPLWITEWNMGTKGLATWKGTGAQLLFIAAVMHENICISDDAPIITYHQIYQELFGTFEYNKESGEINYFATYYLLKLFGNFWADAETVAIPNEAAQVGAPQLVSIVRKADSHEAFIVNRDAKEATIKLEQLAGKRGTIELITLTEEQLTGQMPRNTELAEELSIYDVGTLVIPAYTVARVIIPN
ncbi:MULTISPECIES: hypothetical protein [unclassified Lentimonas]|uniref:hypothetical protein n=1 Tax=unclassified Lentimonas TaxID=2630993 RepID=UPI00132A850F|nr:MULTISPECIES: hypothetical protein [unclassified Lentimonas]CAA6689444.1 Unannotated [Lentimonas sp. CC10]CAA6696416.1 Unannotated [Lentimonas sp. CC19]CAA7070508.1 Unannotated [Lentimonas sp. CC11]